MDHFKGHPHNLYYAILQLGGESVAIDYNDLAGQPLDTLVVTAFGIDQSTGLEDTYNAGIGVHTVNGCTAVYLVRTIEDQYVFRYLSTAGVATIGVISGGSGYVDGSYTNVPLIGTGVSGTAAGATANITVSGGVVTACVIVSDGTGYRGYDMLSASNTNLGGTGSGFSIRVIATLGESEATVLLAQIAALAATYLSTPH